MDKELIGNLFTSFESARILYHGQEAWSARDLQPLLGYARWENFKNAIQKAQRSCTTSGMTVLDHFRDITKMVKIGSDADRTIDDIALTRYACYLIAQNSDSSKDAIMFAQNYFAAQTRRLEIIEQRLEAFERVSEREKLKTSESKLSGVLYERGVDNQGFARIRSKGDQALFSRYTTDEMKQRLGVPHYRALADFLPTVTIMAKSLINELTRRNTVEKNLKGEQMITQEHVDNSKSIRNSLVDRGVTPENLPAEEDIQKIERKLGGDERKLLKDAPLSDEQAN